MTLRAAPGARGMRERQPADLDDRGCPWCPCGTPDGRPPSSHVGLIDGRVVLVGCHWHMKLFVQRGELRALPSAPKVSKRRRG
jgi:hypothetical protein